MPSSGGGTRRVVASTSARRKPCCSSPRPPAMPCAGCSRPFPDTRSVTLVRAPCWAKRCASEPQSRCSPWQPCSWPYYPYYYAYYPYVPYGYYYDYPTPPPGWVPGHWELRDDGSGHKVRVWVPTHLQ